MTDEQQGRIEVELTAHDPPRGRRSRGGRSEATPRPNTTPAPPPLPPPGSQPAPGSPPPPPETQGDTADASGTSPAGWLASDRSRLIATAAAVGVVALLLGWMLGRSGGDGSTADAVAETDDTVAATTTVVDERFEAAETLPGADVDDAVSDTPPPVSAAPVPPPVTTAREDDDGSDDDVTVERFELDERLLGLDVQLVAIEGINSLVELDLATGQKTTRRGLRLTNAEQIVAGDDWAAVPRFDTGSVQIYGADGDMTSISVEDPWSATIDPVAEVLWEVSFRRFDSNEITMTERRLDGRPTGQEIVVPAQAWPYTVDRNSVLVTVVGSTYRLTAAGSTLVARGELHAAGDDRLLLNTCDDELNCGLNVFDLATGESRPIPPDPETGANVNYLAAGGYFGERVDALSPSGRYLLVLVPTEFNEPERGVLDVETGELRLLSDLGFNYPFAWEWSPDERFAFYLSGSTPVAFDVATGESFQLGPERPGAWSAMTIRRSPATTSAAADEAVEG